MINDQLRLHLTDEEEAKIKRLTDKICGIIDEQVYLDHPLDADEKTLIELTATLFFNELKNEGGCIHGCAA